MLFDSLVSQVAAVLSKEMPCIGSSHFLLGVSGGVDSVALLNVMQVLSKEHGFSLSAIHVHHGLRAQADGDALFCEDLCRAKGVTLYTHYLDKHTSSGGIETWAREKRYDCFLATYQAVKADALVLAHHANDQAETQLMHLLRGSGTHGLGGIRQRTSLNGMTVLRPLLMVPKTTLESLGYAYRQDDTNFQADTLRNAIRLEVMPLLEQLAPGAQMRMAQNAMVIADEDAFLDELAAQRITGEPYLRLQPLPAALQRRVLRLFAKGEADRQTTLRLEALLEAQVGASVNLMGGRRIERGYQYLHRVDEMKPVKANVRECTNQQVNGRTIQVFARDSYLACQWRYWQEGDEIIPFGMTGRKSLQDVFVDKKVDRPFRRNIPLLAKGKDIIWIPGIMASEKTRIESPDTCKQEGRLTIEACHPMPWLNDKEERG